MRGLEELISGIVPKGHKVRKEKKRGAQALWLPAPLVFIWSRFPLACR